MKSTQYILDHQIAKKKKLKPPSEIIIIDDPDKIIQRNREIKNPEDK